MNVWLWIIAGNVALFVWEFTRVFWRGYRKSRQENWDRLAPAARKLEEHGWYPERVEWTPRWFPVWPTLHMRHPDGKTWELYEQ